jgi:hypothetical protein
MVQYRDDVRLPETKCGYVLRPSDPLRSAPTMSTSCVRTVEDARMSDGTKLEKVDIRLSQVCVMLTSMSVDAPDCEPFTLMYVLMRLLLFLVPYVLNVDAERALDPMVNWHVEPPDGLTPPDCGIRYVTVSPVDSTSGVRPETVRKRLLIVTSKI